MSLLFFTLICILSPSLLFFFYYISYSIFSSFILFPSCPSNFSCFVATFSPSLPPSSTIQYSISLPPFLHFSPSLSSILTSSLSTFFLHYSILPLFLFLQLSDTVFLLPSLTSLPLSSISAWSLPLHLNFGSLHSPSTIQCRLSLLPFLHLSSFLYLGTVSLLPFPRLSQLSLFPTLPRSLPFSSACLSHSGQVGCEGTQANLQPLSSRPLDRPGPRQRRQWRKPGAPSTQGPRGNAWVGVPRHIGVPRQLDFGDWGKRR